MSIRRENVDGRIDEATRGYRIWEKLKARLRRCVAEFGIGRLECFYYWELQVGQRSCEARHFQPPGGKQPEWGTSVHRGENGDMIGCEIGLEIKDGVLSGDIEWLQKKIRDLG